MSFERTDVALPAAPDSVAIGDLDGVHGNDDITPGAGKDKVAAQGGNDEISARDGERDTIDCGAGRDKVTADRTDSINRNCETVKRAVRRAHRHHYAT